jgi:hypothetical protein
VIQRRSQLTAHKTKLMERRHRLATAHSLDVQARLNSAGRALPDAAVQTSKVERVVSALDEFQSKHEVVRSRILRPRWICVSRRCVVLSTQLFEALHRVAHRLPIVNASVDVSMALDQLREG